MDFSSFKDKDEAKHENASMYFFQSPLKPFAVFNSVGKIGQEISMTKRYPVTIGGYGVKFDKEQTLRGIYGSEKGIVVKPGDVLGFQYYSIATGSDKPLVFHFHTTKPVRLEPIDKHTVADMEVFHDQLGSGKVYGVFHFVAKDGNTSVTMRAVMTFPSE